MPRIVDFTSVYTHNTCSLPVIGVLRQADSCRCAPRQDAESPLYRWSRSFRRCNFPKSLTKPGCPRSRSC